MPILVGIGALRTDEAEQLARDACAAGASAGLLAPVSYAPLTDDEVFGHFEAVAGAAAFPICIYNNPGTTHFTFSAGLVGRLSAIPNVVAVKNPAPDAEGVGGHLRELRGLVPAGFSLGYAVDWHAGGALLAGADAWYSVLAGTLPVPCVAMARAARAGDAAEFWRPPHGALDPVWDLFKRHTSFRVVHAMATILGVPHAVPQRPVLPLSAETVGEVERVLAGLGAG